MSQLLEGLEGVVCQMDDILVFGATQVEHDTRLMVVLDRLHKAGLTLNTKCVFLKRVVKFLGQFIDSSDVRLYPEKVTALKHLAEPQNTAEVRCFNGLVTHLGKYIPNPSEKAKLLRDLLSKDSAWYWGPQQRKAFND